MGLIAKIFGNPKKEVSAIRGYDESAEKAFMEGTLQTVKLAAALMSIVGKWLNFYERLGMSREAVALLSEEEIKCLADNFSIKRKG